MSSSKSIWTVVVLLLIAEPAVAQLPQATEEPKIQLFASGLFNTTSTSFSDGQSFQLYQEEGRFNGDWTSSTGPAFSFGGTYAVLDELSVGAALELLSTNAQESFAAQLPHPLFFNQFRSIGEEGVDLSYKEKVLHFLASYTRNTGRILLAVSGGPSYFWTNVELIDEFTFTDSYPFDEVSGVSTQIKTYDATGFGFNVGGWIGYRFLEQMAVGADLRFTRAKVKFTTSAENEIELDAGGFRLGAGIRVFF